MRPSYRICNEIYSIAGREVAVVRLRTPHPVDGSRLLSRQA